MVIHESNVSRQSEVMVVSSDSGPPRLDLALTRGRRGTFSSFSSDGDRGGLFPRTSRSSNDLFAQALSRIDTADTDSEWGAVRARARENNDREGMADLIDFLRTTAPPPEFPERSVFDDDTEPQEEEPDRWRLFKKLRRPRVRTRSESPNRRPRTAGLPNSAVASKTASGNSHIAISIPLEYCHVGPDSDWALAVFNATPPLPPNLPPRGEVDENNGHPRPYATERTVTVLKAVSERGSISTLNTINTMSTKSQRTSKGTKGSVSIWPKINPRPPSPPKTPYSTPPGSLRGKPSSVSRRRRDRLPLPPPQYAELPASPVIMPQSPDDTLEKNCWLESQTDLIAPPRIPNQHKPKVKQSSKRPDNITLPLRRSSVKIVRPKTETSSNQQRSIDGMIGGATKRRSATSDTPQLSPGFSEAPSITPSISTTELSELVISSARSAKAYSTASIVLQDTDSIPPRQNFAARPGSSDTAQTTLVNESLASRNPSTRTAASRKSRKDHVKSLKQRDMEALRALTKQMQQQEDGEITPRPRTCETDMSSLRLPSRDGTFGATDNIHAFGIDTKLSVSNLANMTKSQETNSSHGSNRTSTKISNWQAKQEVETPGWETAREELTPGWETAQEGSPSSDWSNTNLLNETMAAADSAASMFDKNLARDSTASSEPPRRWLSYHRTSWASSVPLLDRIGSFALSDESLTQIGQAIGSYSSTSLPTRLSRADSATLSQVDSDRLTSPRSSLIDPDIQLGGAPIDFTDRSIAGSIAAFPKPGSGPRLSAIMPVAEVVPSGPFEERWSASTLNSPMTVLEVSHPPFARNQISEQPSALLNRQHPAGNTNSQLMHTSRGDGEETALQRQDSSTDDGDTDETATLRPRSRSREDDPLGLLSMSSRELRNHYAMLRSARVNNLAHEMLLNQERLELRMHQQERNQMAFIDRLERCMNELRSLPASPFLAHRPADWPLDEGDFIYEEQRFSSDARHEVRVRRTGRLQNRPQHQQHQSEPSQRPRRRIVDGEDVFVDFDGDYYERDQNRSQRPSSSHDTPRSRRIGTGRPQHHVSNLPSLVPHGGLDAMEPLIRELQLAARLSQELNRTERIQTPQPGGPNDYAYNMI
ncbi:uncharacterized protein CTRU02_207299 [Colletotrichum truncatum]|uniref:Uncharacterized protein n=1 Tax=Colletotrichum truncatum TaxID=5467 RepID=A0ACC3Z0E4_COLTU|nr:uncharacterized protein CTRU02_01067 [Colletotrichum truncatum]KAF6800662.1 hypothetical protein CTRU02_01067 [Colletotrichum truncatum]